MPFAYCAIVTQVSDKLSKCDVDTPPAGLGGQGSQRKYRVIAEHDTEESAADCFHQLIPIDCLDDFEIEFKKLRQYAVELFEIHKRSYDVLGFSPGDAVENAMSGNSLMLLSQGDPEFIEFAAAHGVGMSAAGLPGEYLEDAVLQGYIRDNTVLGVHRISEVK